MLKASTFLGEFFKEIIKKEKKKPKKTKIVFSKCLLRHGVLRVFVSFYVLVFVRAILS